ncbi:MAG: hypothetical protein H0V72_09835 [Bradyrhizobium sp.]|nr:hypothetical protein [Bradyrhizobium sp.]
MLQFRHFSPKMAALVAAILVCAALAPATAQPAKRSGAGPCRQGALSLIGMLDSGEDNTADYRHAYEAVVQTCGPVAPPTTPAQPRAGQEACGKLARAMLDSIEEGKMNTQGFVQTRSRFAQSCAPRSN